MNRAGPPGHHSCCSCSRSRSGSGRIDRERRRAARAAQFGWGGSRRARSPGVAATSAGWRRRAQPSARRGRSRSSSCLARAAAKRDRRAAARGHGPPRVRCLGEHGGDRRRARPDGGRQDGGARVRRDAAAVACSSASSRSATPASRPRCRRATARRLVAAIERLAPERGTSLGQGIQTSLTAIDRRVHPPRTDYYTNRPGRRSRRRLRPRSQPASYEPGVIVLLTDGENTVAPDPLGAAQAARTGASGSTRRYR